MSTCNEMQINLGRKNKLKYQPVAFAVWDDCFGIETKSKLHFPVDVQLNLFRRRFFIVDNVLFAKDDLLSKKIRIIIYFFVIPVIIISCE